MNFQLTNSNSTEHCNYPTIMPELGAATINLLGCPQFLSYSVGNSSFAPLQNPTGFGLWVPWGPTMGVPRGPTPRFPLTYSQVTPIRVELVYSPATGECVFKDDPKAIVKTLCHQLAQTWEKQAAIKYMGNNLIGDN